MAGTFADSYKFMSFIYIDNRQYYGPIYNSIRLCGVNSDLKCFCMSTIALACHFVHTPFINHFVQYRKAILLSYIYHKAIDEMLCSL